MRYIIYSLKYINDKPVLATDLSGLIISETELFIRVKLTNKTTKDLFKYEYLNTMKVFDDGAGNVFVICTKKVSTESAFSKLINYMVDKIDQRIEKLMNVRSVHQKELAAA